jgi:glycosyltransferase involved in cell wall biosynthesis
MKLSFLLPTRNRLKYLRYAIRSVLRQGDSNWEIVVSDNDSDEDISGYVKSLGNKQIRYYRTTKFISVTENWNNALEQSEGDYIIMLGDDDCVLPSYSKTIRHLAEEYSMPEVIYSSGYLYAYPEVLPDQPQGFLTPCGCASFFEQAKRPYILDKETAHGLVKQSLRFQLRFDYNMQYSTFSRKAVEQMKKTGPFFQSPFPDFYATNSLFLKVERILVCPQPLVVIGITKKSYGYFHFNKKEKVGEEFLKSYPSQHEEQCLNHIVITGSNMDTSWLYAMQTLKKNFGGEFNLTVSYIRYQLLQLLNLFDRLIIDAPKSNEMNQVLTTMRLWVRIICKVFLVCKFIFRISDLRMLLLRARERLGQYPTNWKAEFFVENFANIEEVCEHIAMLEEVKDCKKYTIMLPVHNGGEHVKQCIASILSQRKKNFELVILENASTDGTREWVQSLSDPRIILLASDKLLPIHENWARAMAVPKREFMVWVGADDLLDDNYLEVMEKLIAREPNAKLYFAHFRYIDANGNKIRSCRSIAERETVTDYMKGLFSHQRDTYGTGYLYRSKDYDLVGGMPKWDHLLFADDVLWMSLMKGSWNATERKECFAVRVHSKSYGHLADWRDWIEGMRKYHKFLTGLAEEDSTFKAALAEHAPKYFFGWTQNFYSRLAEQAKKSETPIDPSDLLMIKEIMKITAPEFLPQLGVLPNNTRRRILKRFALTRWLYKWYRHLRYGESMD